MREALVILLSLYGFFLCVNLGFWWIGNTLGVESLTGNSIDFETLNSTMAGHADDFESGGGFNFDFIFGDFGKGLTQFWNIISGGYLLATMTNIGFDENFIFPLQVIAVGYLGVIAGVYYISGRG